MRREIAIGQDGKPVMQLTPENAADEAELQRMIRAGEADARDAFSDDPAVWRKKTPKRRK